MRDRDVILFEKVCFIIKIGSDNEKYCELNMENININLVDHIHFVVFNIISCDRHKCLYLKIESNAQDGVCPNVRTFEAVSSGRLWVISLWIQYCSTFVLWWYRWSLLISMVIREATFGLCSREMQLISWHIKCY